MRTRKLRRNVVGIKKLSQFSANILASTIASDVFGSKTSLGNGFAKYPNKICAVLVKDSNSIPTVMDNENRNVPEPTYGFPVFTDIDKIPSHQVILLFVLSR
eukprot:1246867-Rhodomonas_salina.1